MSAQKQLGQFNTKIKVVENIIRRLPFRNKNISILEPSSGSGNFVNALNNAGFTNIDYYEIDNKYEYTNAKICDFLKEKIDKKYDLIIGNPPFTSRKESSSFYENKFIEKLFIKKSFDLLKKNGQIWFILPNRIFTDRSFKDVIMDFYEYNIFPYEITDMSPIAFEATQCINSILVKFKRGKTDVFTPYGGFAFEEISKNHFNYYKSFTDSCFSGQHLINHFVTKHKFKSSTDQWKITIRNMSSFDETEFDNHKEYYLLVARIGNSSVGKTCIVDTDDYNLNDCFYTFKIHKGAEEIVKNELKSNRFMMYINILSHRVGQKSIKIEDVLSYRF